MICTFQGNGKGRARMCNTDKGKETHSPNMLFAACRLNNDADAKEKRTETWVQGKAVTVDGIRDWDQEVCADDRL